MFATLMLRVHSRTHDCKTIVEVARPDRVVFARRARVRPWASSSVTAKRLGMFFALGDATFQAMVTGAIVRKRADSRLISDKVVPSASTSTIERHWAVPAEARGVAWPSMGEASSTPARARGKRARAARRGLGMVAAILFMAMRPFCHEQTRMCAVIFIRCRCAVR